MQQGCEAEKVGGGGLERLDGLAGSGLHARAPSCVPRGRAANRSGISSFKA